MNTKVTPTEELICMQYDALFLDVASLAQIRYGKSTDTKFDSIKEVTEKLSKDGFLSDYLYTNLSRLYVLYLENKAGKQHEEGWLDNLYDLLNSVIADIQEEINTLMDEGDRHDAEMLGKEING